MRSHPTCQDSHAGAASSSKELEKTALADHLLCTLGEGSESCAGLQKSAAAAVTESSGHCSLLTRSLALIGASGKHARNAQRDLFRLLELLIESWRDLLD